MLQKLISIDCKNNVEIVIELSVPLSRFNKDHISKTCRRIGNSTIYSLILANSIQQVSRRRHEAMTVVIHLH